MIQNISFTADGFTLAGTLYLPKAKMPPVVIGSHGLFSSSGSPKQQALADACGREGMAFFRFDHRGCGNSQGIFHKVTSLPNRVKDLKEAMALMLGRQDLANRIGLFGSSMGGAVALRLASEERVQALVTLAAPIRSEPVLQSAVESGDLRGRSIDFYEKNLNFDLSEQISGVSRILVIHGGADQVVPVASCHEIYEKSSDPKRLVIQKKGDHRVSSEIHQKEFVEESVSWFKKWLRP